MTDRRRGPRYVLTTPLPADAMPMEDATVEQLSGDRLVVVAPSPAAVDDALIVHVATADGMVSHHARVMSSNPVAVAGTVQFRIELRLDDRARRGEPS